MFGPPTPKRRGTFGLRGETNPLSTLVANGGFSPGTLGRNDLFNPDFLRKPASQPVRRPVTLHSDDGADASEATPAYRETWKTHVAVSLVGHASPRYRSADTPEKADRKNLELSQKRVRSVREAVERIIRFELKDHKVDFKFNESQAPGENTGVVTIGTDAKGSKETLIESGGDRTAVGKQYQRVDVRVDLTHLIEGEAPSQQLRSVRKTTSVATRNWALNLGGTLDLHIGLGMSLSAILLKNRETKRWVNGAIVGYGFGGSVFGALKSVEALKAIKTGLSLADKAFAGGCAYSFGGWRDFRTDTPKRFYDFDGALMRLTTVGVNLFVGASVTKLTIIGFGAGAEGMDHSGFEVGKPKFGGFVDVGYIDLALLDKIDEDISKWNVEVEDQWES